MTTGQILVVILAVLYMLLFFVPLTGNKTIINILWANISPRTDIKYMTKKELYQSGVWFMAWGVGNSIILSIYGYIFIKSNSQYPLDAGIYFILFMLSLVGLAGGLYILIRAIFRSNDYIPPPIDSME